MASLDVDAVQAFVLVADLGSFTLAAHAIGTSQAAVSVKVKRLEDRLGFRLLDRTPRKVQLSAQGLGFLNPARNFIAAHELAIGGLSSNPRRLVVGISDQVAGPRLPALLAKLGTYDPALVIEVHIDSSQCLMQAFDKKTLDAAIVRREDDRRDGEELTRERIGWFASADWEHCEASPLRLASLSMGCGVRGSATQALDKAGIAWTEVFIGGGMAAIGAAVSAGLAIAALAHSVAPIGTVEVGRRYNLPPLPDSDVVLHSTRTDAAFRGALRTLAAYFRGSNVVGSS
ncbi:DNA-binding transcriptional LysR family regulator [Rhodanobacter sp. ANJX3]|uniref:LysR family transcriptional regulator n=1 Tax=Rhodanobacter sp. ANJX3 TaxID=2723083 RepID=UPI00161196F7|nr:LysR family transcriptional regulator [Rhodanobacter sp. ANJX3]MBB5360009.1 DNA-binding transcriptional LysR family regulator [Rhodanobacter sp. ANJX3]